MSRWALVISVRCRKVPGGPVKVPTWMRSSSRRSSGQVLPQAFSAIRAKEKCQPAQDDVGADAVFPAVVDGAQVDDLLHVPPRALSWACSITRPAPSDSTNSPPPPPATAPLMRSLLILMTCSAEVMACGHGNRRRRQRGAASLLVGARQFCR